ncbi:hypothetical protein [Rossellomorea marisflavi]|uniref:hypothetical protein n=1 Tax=Rossellomorea marisflavi TaxID=189381 RepID=UPI001153E708|nr:hypothetical protein [Rossellomorea marisflavi]
MDQSVGTSPTIPHKCLAAEVDRLQREKRAGETLQACRSGSPPAPQESGRPKRKDTSHLWISDLAS